MGLGHKTSDNGSSRRAPLQCDLGRSREVPRAVGDSDEGTIIEPSLEFGYQYLNATAYWSTAHKNQQLTYDGIPVPKAIYDAAEAIRLAEKQPRMVGLHEAPGKLLEARDDFYSERYSTP